MKACTTEMTDRAVRWTTEGPVRGSCGHMHRTEEAALACLDRDSRGCASQGGYSDRRVVTVPAVPVCPACGAQHGGENYDGVYYCSECYHHLFCACARCNSVIPAHDARLYETEAVCPACWDALSD